MLLLLTLACASPPAEKADAAPDSDDGGAGDDTAPAEVPTDSADPPAETGEPWPEGEVDWQASVSLVYAGAVLADGAQVELETAPAGLDEASELRFTLTNRSDSPLDLSTDLSAWLVGEGFTWTEAPPSHLDPEQSAGFTLSVNPLDAFTAETRLATLTIPTAGGPTIAIHATIPRPLRLVLAADGPSLLTSDDYGATWTPTVAPATIDHRVHALTWGEGRFFLAAQEGFGWSVAGTYQWSEDGSAWTPSAVSEDFWVSDCTHGLDRFFCVRSDTVSWSETGETVLHEATSWANMLNVVLFTGDRFLAGGRGGRRVYSTDGSSWSADVSSTNTDYIQDLAMDDAGNIVSVGGWGGNRYTFGYSTDGGLTWTEQSICDQIYTRLESVAWGNGIWLAGGASNLCDGLYQSTDGQTWTALLDQYIYLLGFVNGWFIGATFPWGSPSQVVRSVDGASWETVYTMPTGASPRAIALEGR